MKAAGLLLLGAAMTLGFWAVQAEAQPAFKTAFQKKYVDKGSPELKAAFKKESCNTCHVKGAESKTERNDYGKALAEFLGPKWAEDYKAAHDKEDTAAVKKLVSGAVKKLMTEGFDKVAEEKAPSGKTFGEMIKDGKLPASK